jgi:hypothetical protein
MIRIRASLQPGLKPEPVLHALLGAEAPLFHGTARIRKFSVAREGMPRHESFSNCTN